MSDRQTEKEREKDKERKREKWKIDRGRERIRYKDIREGRERELLSLLSKQCLLDPFPFPLVLFGCCCCDFLFG
jgi:hypothetical protein